MAAVLLVDDEEALLGLMRRYLERSGHQVESAGSAEAARAAFAARPEDFDLVITDLSLPGTNGEELIGQMRKTRPDLKALISSGYAYEPQGAGIGFLQKPFLPKALEEAVKKALAGG